jgi:pimeloyl-ACP methyl ester carboxylesterase
MEPTERIAIGGPDGWIEIPIVRCGSGPQLLFLSGAGSFRRSGSWLEAMAREFQVIVPIHPGFGGARFAAHVRTVGDLALAYLSLLDRLGSAIVVGSSFGGWIAAEMAVRNCSAIQSLVLIDSLGFKFGGVSDRDIFDLYATPTADVTAALFHRPEVQSIDLAAATDQELGHLVEDRAAETYYGWSPYMHTPDLHRWLHRISSPTLVLWGESDGVVPASYGRKISERIAGARFHTVAGAGHYPHVENPSAVVSQIRTFLTAR